jgi:hypothetical protein
VRSDRWGGAGSPAEGRPSAGDEVAVVPRGEEWAVEEVARFFHFL